MTVTFIVTIMVSHCTLLFFKRNAEKFGYLKCASKFIVFKMDTSNVLLRPEDEEIVTLRKDWIMSTYGLSSCHYKAGRMVFKGGAHSLAADYAKSLLSMTTDKKFVQSFPAAVWRIFHGNFKDRLEGVYASVIDTSNPGNKTNPKFSVKCSSGLNCCLLTTVFDELKASAAISDKDGEKHPTANVDFDNLVQFFGESSRHIQCWSTSLKHVIMSQMFYNDCSDLKPYSLVYKNCRVSYSREQGQVIYETLPEDTTQDQREIFSNYNGAWNQLEPDVMLDIGGTSPESASIEVRGDGKALERLLDDKFVKKPDSVAAAFAEEKRSAMIKDDVLHIFFEPQFYTTVREAMFTQLLNYYYTLFVTHYKEFRGAYRVHDITEREFNEAMVSKGIAYFEKGDYHVSAYSRKEIPAGCNIPTVAYSKVAQTPIPQSESSRSMVKVTGTAKTVTADGPVIVAAPVSEDFSHLLTSNNTVMLSNKVHSQRLLNINLSKPSTKVGALLRGIYIDGPNVACSFGNNGKSFNCRGLAVAVRLFYERGHRKIRVVVPDHRIQQSYGEGEPPMDDSEGVLDLLIDMNILVSTSSSSTNKKTHRSYDDRTLLSLASSNKGVVLSNDQFRDLQTSKYISGDYRRLGFTCDGEDFLIHHDPCGQNGADLDQWLMMNAHDQEEMRAKKKRNNHSLGSFVPSTDRSQRKQGFKRSHADQNSMMSTSPSLQTRLNPLVPSSYVAPQTSNLSTSPFGSMATTSVVSPNRYTQQQQTPIFAPRTSKPANSLSSVDFSHTQPHYSSGGRLNGGSMTNSPTTRLSGRPKKMTVPPNRQSSPGPRSMTFPPNSSPPALESSMKDEKMARLLDFFPERYDEVRNLVETATPDESIDTLATKMLNLTCD